MKIRIFVRLHRYRQRQILVLSESITPWARPIRRVTSWLDPPSLCTTLPRYVKLFKISMSSPHAWTDFNNYLGLQQLLWTINPQVKSHMCLHRLPAYLLSLKVAIVFYKYFTNSHSVILKRLKCLQGRKVLVLLINIGSLKHDISNTFYPHDNIFTQLIQINWSECNSQL